MGKAIARSPERSSKDDDAPQYGPAMAALISDRYRDFVTAYVLNGGKGAPAARRAGFSDKSQGCRVRAFYLLRREDVQAAGGEGSRIVLRAGAPRAVARLNQIINKGKDQDALRGISEVLARVDPVTTGHVIAVQHDHRHHHTLSADEIIARIAALAAQVGVEPRLPPERLSKGPVTIDLAAAERT